MTLQTANPARGGATGLGNIDCLAAVDTRVSSAKPYGVQAVRRVDFGLVNRAALTALPAILARLLPGGKIISGEYVALNPTRADRRLGSFKVRLSGSRAGRWCDFATGDKGGDPVSLVAYVERVSQVEAARRVAQMLGVNWDGR